MQTTEATTTREITVRTAGKQLTIPANTDTTARISAGNEALVAIKYQGITHLVPVTAVRFL